MIDLWGDEEKLDSPEDGFPDLGDRDAKVMISGDDIVVFSRSNLASSKLFEHFRDPSTTPMPGGWRMNVRFRPSHAFLIRYLLRGLSVDIDSSVSTQLKESVEKLPSPVIKLSEDARFLEVTAPGVGPYLEALKFLNGYPTQKGFYRIQVGKFLDLMSFSESIYRDYGFPQFRVSRDASALFTEPLPGFDGTMDSLKLVPVSELNVVKANSQSYKSRSKSSASLAEKLSKFGIESVFDLIHWLPRRYIDKSKPQEISDLVLDETATVVGKVDSVAELGMGKGVVFSIRTEAGQTVRATFWRQTWLRQKFPVGSEVLVTGKFGFYGRTPQINGTSIESAQEASLLPIVPIYRQSESRGITTAFLLSAIREVFARVETIRLPSYLEDDGKRATFDEMYREVHLPTDLEHNTKMLNALAYFELTMMQLLIQEQREISEARPGISQKGGSGLQEKARKLLPFSLTGGQSEAVSTINDKLADSSPSATLLTADVGSGKTVVSQLACLRSVDSGFQAALIAPTEVLATQLYSGFVKMIEGLNEAGENLTIEYLGASTKGAEKKRILKSLADGSTKIVVGTHAVLSASVKFDNLGLVVVDEQQKFGTEQRSALLSSRSDGKVVDVLMQSATPIPRSIAQVFYGDVDMVVLSEKPPGRLPIVTEWIEEDPNHIAEQTFHPMWGDLNNEIAAGNQVFIVTPLVQESDKIDAASVEASYSTLSKQAFSNVRTDFVHGKMPAAELQEKMLRFRNKEIDVLVSSTVVEVGVDIPDATRVVILSADRLGASSLHQIRGRVGRNSKPSKCYLVSLGKTPSSRIRMQSLVDSENGFEVAKTDLLTRGEGTVFGDSQSGASEMVFASLSKHGKLVERAAKEAKVILSSENREKALSDSREFFALESRQV